MIISNRKKQIIKYLLIIGVIFSASILLYVTVAFRILIWDEARGMRKCFREIAEIQMKDLDEEDEEILDGYQAEKIGAIIADRDLNVIYRTFDKKSEGLIEKYFRHNLKDYTEKGTMEVKEYSSFDVIRFRGLLNQDGDVYYVLLRKEISGMDELIRYSSWYFLIVMLILLVVSWRILKKNPYIMHSVDGKKTLAEKNDKDLKSAQKEFIANISHELKTPLAVISSQVEMLQTMGDNIDRDYYFESIREEIDKMSGLIGNLLDLTIMEHKLESMSMTNVDVSEMLEYMILKYDALFKKNGIKVKTEVQKKCVVKGNRMFLEEAVNNYLMNAFQHTAQGKNVEIRLLHEQEECCICVKNQGMIIRKEDEQHIWESFYHASANQVEENTAVTNAGIGLFVVKNIVEQHKGTCGVINEEDGVEFWIRLPLV